MTVVVGLLLIGAVLAWPVGRRGSGPLRDQGAAAGSGADRSAMAPTGAWPGRLRRWWRHEWRAGAVRLNPQAEFADALALALGSGLPGPAAWSLAARSVPEGEPVLGADDVLSRAWRLSHELGAPLVTTIESVAATIRSRSAARARQRALLAGPKASMMLLTGLPIVGPMVAPLLGLNVLADNGIGRFTVPGGLLLTGFGWWWSRLILRRAARPPTVLSGVSGTAAGAASPRRS